MSSAHSQEEAHPKSIPAAEAAAPAGPEHGQGQEVPPKNEAEAALLEALKKAEGDTGAVEAASAKVAEEVSVSEKASAKKLDDVASQTRDLAPDVADAFRNAMQKHVADKQAAAGRTKEALQSLLKKAEQQVAREEKILGIKEQAAAKGPEVEWKTQAVEEQRQRVAEAQAKLAEVQAEAGIVALAKAEAVVVPVAAVATEAPMATPAKAEVVATAPLQAPASVESVAMAAGNVPSLDLGEPASAKATEAPKSAEVPRSFNQLAKDYNIQVVNVATGEMTPAAVEEQAIEVASPVGEKEAAAPEAPTLSREEIRNQQEAWRQSLQDVMSWRKDAEARQASLSTSEQSYFTYSSALEALADVQEAYLENEGKMVDGKEALAKIQAEMAGVQEELAAKFEERQKLLESLNAYNKQATDLEQQYQQPDLDEAKKAKLAYDMRRIRGEQAVLRSHIDDIGREMQDLEDHRGEIQGRMTQAETKLAEAAKQREVLAKEREAATATEQMAKATYESAAASLAVASAQAAESARAATASAESAVDAGGDVAARAEALSAEVKQQEAITAGDVASYAARNSGRVGTAAGLVGGTAVMVGIGGAKFGARVGERAWAGFAGGFYNLSNLLSHPIKTLSEWKNGFAEEVKYHGVIRGLWRGMGRVLFGAYDKRMEDLDKGDKMREEEAKKKAKSGGAG
jgi:hypothetical protein